MLLLISGLMLFMQVTKFQNPEFSSSETVYTSKESSVRFYSHAPLEDIEATSTKLRGAMTAETGKLLFVIPINSFEFEKQLMQKHFNEQYLESDKYPEARFEGKFKNPPIELSGSNMIQYEGFMTLHGVSRHISGKAELKRVGNSILGHSTISIRLEDYKIKVPRMVIKNIAEVVEVTINVTFISELNP